MEEKSKVYRIPEHIAVKIAAGEVIERPANVLKELLDNSIDAGASKIEVEIEDGGKKLITVKDNGCGMRFEDIPLLMGKVLVGTKYVLKQHRGRFGLGGKMAIIHAELETGCPCEIYSATKDDKCVSHYVLKIDLRSKAESAS